MTVLETRNDPVLAAEIRALAEERNAVILAHNYERPEVQDVADYVGDSLGLSREAANTDAEVIVFCGVHFMAETAAILSPHKTVLLPDLAAGCSLAASIDAEQLRAWKAEHPGAVVVSYVNTTADVKAETDYCCTSGNAVEVINAIPAETEILFCPDMFLGAHLRRENPTKKFIAASDRAQCAYMKVTTLPKVRRALETMTHRITVAPDVAARARLAIERMVAIGGR